jgi:hypothetical protein
MRYVSSLVAPHSNAHRLRRLSSLRKLLLSGSVDLIKHQDGAQHEAEPYDEEAE